MKKQKSTPQERRRVGDILDNQKMRESGYLQKAMRNEKSWKEKNFWWENDVMTQKIDEKQKKIDNLLQKPYHMSAVILA